MTDIINFLKRNAAWVVLAVLSILMLKPAMAELNTILLIILFESLAIFLSGVAVFAFTKIDFIGAESLEALARIFAAVHLSVGLIVIGVYIAQIGAV